MIKINKILIFSLLVIILLAAVTIIFIATNPVKDEAGICDFTAERILYLISPLGSAEYNNIGLVELNGRMVNLITLRTRVLLVDDLEKIYSDPVSLLPLKVERTILKFWGNEYKTEEYDQEKFTLVTKEFKGKKLVRARTIHSDKPIQNVVTFLFYLRKNPDLKVGWNYTVRVPDEFKPEIISIKLKLVSIDQITIPAGKFQAYHFKSVPDKFELWINKDDPRVLLKIKIKSFIDFNVLMKKCILGNNPPKEEGKR